MDLLVVRHRVSRVEVRMRLPRDLGAEIDLRSRGDAIVLQHEPFTDGDPLAPSTRIMHACAW